MPEPFVSVDNNHSSRHSQLVVSASDDPRAHPLQPDAQVLPDADAPLREHAVGDLDAVPRQQRLATRRRPAVRVVVVASSTTRDLASVSHTASSAASTAVSLRPWNPRLRRLARRAFSASDGVSSSPSMRAAASAISRATRSHATHAGVDIGTRACASPPGSRSAARDSSSPMPPPATQRAIKPTVSARSSRRCAIGGVDRAKGK